MNFTRDMNDGRNVFVFGSNEAGAHGGGAAREAFNWWGAEMNVGFGRIGASFAIPTMDWELRPLPLETIQHYIARFIAYAKTRPQIKFLVTAVGTGICGYSAEEIAPMFNDAPDNCVLPDGWRK